MSEEVKKAHAFGVNHLVLEVDDLDQTLEFYSQSLRFDLRARSKDAAFVDLGDQFLQLSVGKTQAADGAHYFVLVVDAPDAVRAELVAMGVTIFGRLRFRDLWGNRVEVVDYKNIQFSKLPPVLDGMGLGQITKTPAAFAELQGKGTRAAD